MLEKIKSIGQVIALKGISFSEDFGGILAIKGLGKLLWNLKGWMENLFYYLYEISYNNSREETFDANTLAFEDDWKCYNSKQRIVIRLAKNDRRMSIDIFQSNVTFRYVSLYMSTICKRKGYFSFRFKV